VTLARELDPDVVLLDLSMPGVGGIEAIEAMLRDDAARRVLVLAGSADPADRAKAEQAGAVGYLTKEQIADELVPGVLAAAR
jgi:two-component system invasion response regulator UvrY